MPSSSWVPIVHYHSIKLVFVVFKFALLLLRLRQKTKFVCLFYIASFLLSLKLLIQKILIKNEFMGYIYIMTVFCSIMIKSFQSNN
jgi:hypothetical protein